MENTSDDKKIPIIIGDIGGTNSRLSIVKMSKKFADDVEVVKTTILNSKEYKNIVELLKHFLEVIYILNIIYKVICKYRKLPYSRSDWTPRSSF
jgi:glucokinase